MILKVPLPVRTGRWEKKKCIVRVINILKIVTKHYRVYRQSFCQDFLPVLQVLLPAIPVLRVSQGHQHLKRSPQNRIKYTASTFASTPASTPSIPASTPSTPASTPSTPASTPSTSASTPASTLSTPAINSTLSTHASTYASTSTHNRQCATPIVPLYRCCRTAVYLLIMWLRD